MTPVLAERAADWRERFAEVATDPADEIACAAGFAHRARTWERRALALAAKGKRREREGWILCGSLESGEAWTAAVVCLLRAIGGAS